MNKVKFKKMIQNLALKVSRRLLPDVMLIDKKTPSGSSVSEVCQLKDCLVEYGWTLSRQLGMPVTKDNQPLPWYTYPAIEYLSNQNYSDFNVFEYGSGNSSLWWADKVRSLYSCEHELEWFNKMKPTMPSNVSYYHVKLVEDGAYCKKCTTINLSFDIIIIDGRDRINCAKNSIHSLNESGIIIWDNSDRSKYNEGYEFLQSRDFKRLDFWGIGPINSYKWCTSIFYRNSNCLSI